MSITKEYEEILEYVKGLSDSPFKFPLYEYCSDITSNPRCYICDNKNVSGIEVGMSPDFDKIWTKGWNVCFHICHNCSMNQFHDMMKFRDEITERFCIKVK